MRPQHPNFKLTRQAILLSVISAAYPMAGYAAIAGRTDFVVGSVEAIAPDGSRRPLIKGSEVNTGDSINTAAGARAQVRFNDGGYVSLQPNTVFRVDQFNYQNQTDGNEKGFFSLLKGGLRAITGAIGHVNRETYKVATPNATIGIRGTGYRAEIRDNGLFVSVGEGAISLTNNVGLLVVTAGNAAFVASPNTPPTPSQVQPSTPPAPLQPLSPIGTILPPTLPNMTSGAGYSIGYAYIANSTGFAGSASNLNATFATAGQLATFIDSPINTTISGDIAGGTIAFSATDGIIAWGRWVGSYSTNLGTVPPAPFDYVIGIPTASIAMPTSGTATYSLMGYTNPTSTDSTSWTVSGNVSYDFSIAPLVKVNMTLTNSSAQNYVISGSTTIAPTFNIAASTTGTACNSACSTSINGFFAGASAERVGLSYQVADPGFRYVQGVAAFAKQ
ncbi:MAG TPA: FecR family protein [Gallionellaceae bacterium]